MNDPSLVVAFDTSAYTTSMAVLHKDGTLLLDLRYPLHVPQGMRGLRQQDAKDQHRRNLKEILGKLEEKVLPLEVSCIAVSDKPRPLEGSYMPVFNEGVDCAAFLAESWNKPLYRFSHQEGHVAAIQHFAKIVNPDDFMCFHLSGGTTELLHIAGNEIKIIGGSRDLSVGQVIDRVGVSYGMAFPAGKEMDRYGSLAFSRKGRLTPVAAKDLFFNLSGIESNCQRLIAAGISKEELIPELFSKLGECIGKTIEMGVQRIECKDVILAGGVSESRSIRGFLRTYYPKLPVIFGEYGSDNAVGTAILGGMKTWHQNR